jgi:hypothetical protein
MASIPYARILAHKNNAQKAPVSILPVVVAFAQAASRHDDAKYQGDSQKKANDNPIKS